MENVQSSTSFLFQLAILVQELQNKVASHNEENAGGYISPVTFQDTSKKLQAYFLSGAGELGQ